MAQAQVKNARMGIWTLSLLNVAAVLSIVNFPEQAEYGYQIIFYVTASAICFFLPTALVSAELASAWPHDGGLFLWGKEAFGPGWGFVTVSMQWLNSLPWFATVLTFAATTLAYIFYPPLAQNRLYVYLMIVGTMWGCTLLNCRGIRLYALLTSNGALIGTVLPTVVMIIGAVIYLLRGNAPAIAPSEAAFFPELRNWNDWMLLAGMMVALAGIDMTAIHVTDVDNPQKNFPRAILIASIITVIASIGGALAIALVVKPQALSMASGAGEAFDRMFTALGVPWMTPVICILLIIGALTTVITWILGPSKGLLEVAKEGYLPDYWQQRNERGIPVHILFLQATISSVLSLVVFFMPTIGGAFWWLMALSAQMYMTMYLLMFAAAFRLRFDHPEVPRPFRVPGGKVGMGIVCGIGMLTAFTAMISGLIPPSSIQARGTGAMVLYVAILLGLTLFFIVTPIWIGRWEKQRHQTNANSKPADR